jgi:DNA-directed RNA polymerase subunit RPC12/RpoP
MATVVDFECPACSARCCAETRRGQVVRCPHCFSFVTIPEPKPPQLKAGGRRWSPDDPARRGAPDSSGMLDREMDNAPEPLIVFMCTHCQTRIETDPANAGLACICPGCHVNLTIPGNAKPIFPQVAVAPRSSGRGLISERIMTVIVLAVVSLGALIAFLSFALRDRPLR